MKIVFIRHGYTRGNIEKRYIGRTDEPLSEFGKNKLKEINYPDCGILFCSPMKRCKETAVLIYPGKKTIICDEFRECDFGDFEGKNYSELNGDHEYQRWIDSGGNAGFPNGESPEKFRERCIFGFKARVLCLPDDVTAGFVVHGGTIMSILERYSFPNKSFYEWSIENGHGYICDLDKQKQIIKVIEKI